MSDKHYVDAVKPATRLVEAVHAGDIDTVRDVLLACDEASLWALTVALAAMAPKKPNPERVLQFACGVEARLTYSARPETWSTEDLQDALMVARARTSPDAMWVHRGVDEWRRRREARDEHVEAANAAAIATRHQDQQLDAVV